MYWGAVFLLLEEEYWRSPFLINFIGVIIEAGNETREKKFGVILVLKKSKERSKKRVVFVHTAVFELKNTAVFELKIDV